MPAFHDDPYVGIWPPLRRVESGTVCVERLPLVLHLHPLEECLHRRHPPCRRRGMTARKCWCSLSGLSVPEDPNYTWTCRWLPQSIPGPESITSL